MVADMGAEEIEKWYDDIRPKEPGQTVKRSFCRFNTFFIDMYVKLSLNIKGVLRPFLKNRAGVTDTLQTKIKLKQGIITGGICSREGLPDVWT